MVRLAAQRTEPRIRYATTADGVGIAFCTMGEGLPLVIMPSIPLSHVQLEWHDPERRRWYERLAERWMVVRYDNRGSGLSDASSDFSLAAQTQDLDAVLGCLGIERCALFAQFHAGPPAIAYAVSHPERVSHLILWHSFARASDYLSSPRVQALHSLIDEWELFVETAAHAWVGWSTGEPARRMANFMRRTCSPEIMRAALAMLWQYDVEGLLPQVRTPTLVLHREGWQFSNISICSSLVSRIPGAQMVVVSGEAGGPSKEHSGEIAHIVDEFLSYNQVASRNKRFSGSGDRLLTDRELEVLTLLAAGLSNEEVARELIVALSTVKKHAINIYTKLGVRSRTQAIARARSLRLL